MKILTVVHDFNNFGGIVSHTEQLIAGFKDLGHQADFVFLRSTKSHGIINPSSTEGYDRGEGTLELVHQGKGWTGKYLSFINDSNVETFVNIANNYDLIVWQSIFGFKCQDSEKKTSWLKMIKNVKAKQIVIVHDGNLRKYYPWIHHVKDHITGLACVHPSAYEQASWMEIPRALILNPQKIVYKKTKKFSERSNSILSIQTFKRWKRVDDLVAAVPYINAAGGKVILGGDGIERAYMASVEKCKEEYYCTPTRDPAADPSRYGKRIWENALDCGMEYVGFISEAKRDEYLQDVKFLLDPSWSKTYGEHFNRVVVDAMKQGVVPIARNLGISNNENGIGIFKPNENYLMIPWNATPKEFGDKINEFLNMDPDKYDEIVQNNWKFIKRFDRKQIASEYIDFAANAPWINIETGKYNTTLDKTIDGVWVDHFGFEHKLNASSSLDALFG